MYEIIRLTKTKITRNNIKKIDLILANILRNSKSKKLGVKPSFFDL